MAQPATSIDVLVRETRARREALHDLIERMRRDWRQYSQDQAALATRPRLTRDQRNTFRRLLKRQ